MLGNIAQLILYNNYIMNKLFKKNLLVTFFLLSFCVIHAKTVNLSDFTSGRNLKQAFEAAIKTMSDNDVLFVKAGTYTMNELIFITKKITIRGAKNNKTVFIKTNNPKGVDRRYCFVTTKNGVKFENLVIDGNRKVTRTIINTNNRFGIKVLDCVIRNAAPAVGLYFGASGISSEIKVGNAWREGTATDGLVVKRTTFNNIQNVCIYIINRNTNVSGKEIRSLSPITIESCVFKNYRRAITADCGNDYRDPDCRSSKRRFSTKINTVISDCVFELAEAWHVDAVQASNIQILNNVMKGPKITPNSDVIPLACLHIEELSNNILIKDNQMDSSIEKCIMIDIEATRKWRTCDKEYAKDDVNRYAPEWTVKDMRIVDNTFTGKALFAISGNDTKDITITKNQFKDFTGRRIIYFKKGKEGACNVFFPVGSQTNTNKNVDKSKVRIEWKAGCGDTNPFRKQLVTEAEIDNEVFLSVNNKVLSVNSSSDIELLTVYALSGAPLYESSSVPSNSTINFQSLDAGVYIVTTVTKEGKQKSSKLIF